jgi:hypothetical protein
VLKIWSTRSGATPAWPAVAASPASGSTFQIQRERENPVADRVEDADDHVRRNRDMCLKTDHVLIDPVAELGDRVVRPGDREGGSRIGSSERLQLRDAL